jgi:hypothetical protein
MYENVAVTIDNSLISIMHLFFTTIGIYRKEIFLGMFYFGKEPNQEEKRQLTYNLLISAGGMECMDNNIVIAEFDKLIEGRKEMSECLFFQIAIENIM